MLSQPLLIPHLDGHMIAGIHYLWRKLVAPESPQSTTTFRVS